MEHTLKGHGELEVTGVSRSGRVCKKSSKLMDFQSPDDIDPKQKKPSGTPKSGARVAIGMDSDEPDDETLLHTEDSDAHDRSDGAELMASDDDDDDDDEDDEDDGGIDDSMPGLTDALEPIGDKRDGELLAEMTPKSSLYMSEKTSRYKKAIKDGKLTNAKVDRKEKGKRRFTAYMLWAKDVRQNLLTNLDHDFGTVSKRLGEMWANVPSNQKHNWKQRAKRIASRFKQTGDKAMQSRIVQRYLNAANQPVATAARNKKLVLQHAKNVGTVATAADAVKPSVSSTPVGDSPGKGASHLKLPGYQPADVAAHLMLLGDNLTIIGERLMEHQGQITVSGSLSVLLDSLVCSLGPLMCLTVHLPGMEPNAEYLKDLFQCTLDNIAYVMPGL